MKYQIFQAIKMRKGNLKLQFKKKRLNGKIMKIAVLNLRNLKFCKQKRVRSISLIKIYNLKEKKSPDP